MDYEVVWELMSSLISELRKAGETVPAKSMSDLRAAKTMMEVHKVDPSRSENLQRIEEYLTSLETLLVPVANRKFGKEYVDAWLRKLGKAYVQPPKWEPRLQGSFPVGVPREDRWVRVEATEKISTEKIKHAAKQIGLNSKTEKDGRVLVFGEEQKLKQFVKTMAEKVRGDDEKR